MIPVLPLINTTVPGHQAGFVGGVESVVGVIGTILVLAAGSMFSAVSGPGLILFERAFSRHALICGSILFSCDCLVALANMGWLVMAFVSATFAVRMEVLFAIAKRYRVAFARYFSWRRGCLVDTRRLRLRAVWDFSVCTLNIE